MLFRSTCRSGCIALESGAKQRLLVPERCSRLRCASQGLVFAILSQARSTLCCISATIRALALANPSRPASTASYIFAPVRHLVRRSFCEGGSQQGDGGTGQTRSVTRSRWCPGLQPSHVRGLCRKGLDLSIPIHKSGAFSGLVENGTGRGVFFTKLAVSS